MVEPVQPRFRLSLSSSAERLPAARGRARPARMPQSTVRSPRRLLRVLVTAVAVSCTLAFALALGLRHEPVEAPGASARAAEGVLRTSVFRPPVEPTGQEPTTSASARATLRTPEFSAPEATRRFAWAPVAGATGYHVKFFRRDSLVFAADTTGPGITIPAQRGFAERLHSLGSQEYRWYVWPIVAGRRAAEAVVQAKFVVSDRRSGADCPTGTRAESRCD